MLGLGSGVFLNLSVGVEPLEEDAVQLRGVDERVLYELLRLLTSELIKEGVDEVLHGLKNRVLLSLVQALDQEGDQGLDLVQNEGLAEKIGPQPVKDDGELSDEFPVLRDQRLEGGCNDCCDLLLPLLRGEEVEHAVELAFNSVKTGLGVKVELGHDL